MFLTQEEGYYALTKTGMVSLYLLVALFVLFTLFSVKPDKEHAGAEKKSRISVRQLVFSAAALALAFVLSFIRLFSFPWGGSVTLCSMLFVTLIGYWYGPRVGLTAAFAYGLLEFVQDGGSYVLSPLQAGLDYLFAFTALGLSGFFRRKKNGLLIGYLAAILVRGLMHTIGGYLYWMDYMPESFPPHLAALYPVIYNYAYILGEGLITVILISIPAIRRALKQTRILAVPAEDVSSVSKETKS
ncbi:MAG: energy-coupled thiamine transporter ThiT [Lachnospiraceae bacterium]|nr:energy-coupled thiamine transporter ThiT [Lachnospiraceae bacterium]